MLDSAVTWFGITIENALAERVKVKKGSEVEYRPRYTLTHLLHPMFKLPKPPDQNVEVSLNPFAPLLAAAGKSNGMVRRFKYVGPPDKKVEDTDG